MKFKKIFIMLSAVAVLSISSFATSSTAISQSSDVYRTQDAFANIYEKAKDSVVNIRTRKTITVNTFNPLEAFLFGTSGRRQIQRESGSLGSGFIVSNDGYVMTNNHVIDGADEIYVKGADGYEYSAKIIGGSPEVDIAILKINSSQKFTPLNFADSDNIKIGHWAIAFGNPLGLNSSMTVGVIGASGRSSLGIEQIENFIQTDAAINQGNSGGPLLDINGNVVGVNTAIYSTTGGNIGISFAIPSNLARNVKDSIIRTGKYERPYLGVSIRNLTSDDTRKMNLPSSTGLLVENVFQGSPAAKAGLKVNDFISEMNGRRIYSAGAFLGELAAKKAGETVTLKIHSDEKEKTVNVVLGKMTQQNLQQR